MHLIKYMYQAIAVFVCIVIYHHSVLSITASQEKKSRDGMADFKKCLYISEAFLNRMFNFVRFCDKVHTLRSVVCTVTV